MTRTLCLIAALLTTPLFAQTEADPTWVRASYDAFEPSDLGIALRYGVPQSDFVILVANCTTPGDGTTQITLSLSANPGNSRNGDPVGVEFDGFTGAISGVAIGIGAEFGITGATVEISTTDPFWAQLAIQSELRYRLAGQSTWITLPAEPALLQSFVADCAALATNDSGGSPLPSASFDPETGIGFCSEEQFARSDQLGPELSITLSNQTGETQRVFWIDENGARVELGSLAAGQSATLDTRATHVWLIADASGNCMELRRPLSDITLTPPAPANGK